MVLMPKANPDSAIQDGTTGTWWFLERFFYVLATCVCLGKANSNV